MSVEKLVERIKESHARLLADASGKLHYTVEFGKGETYVSEFLTLYAHDKYPRSSVMAGRSRRSFIEDFEDEAEARKVVKAAGIEAITDFDCGSTHVPVSEATAGLPGEDGWPSYGEIDW
jgi:hypothetical protein